ncbi:MAG: UrcA family protein [Parvularculaceae bacterium]|nr:UrcA family protein [Parvularculaceae bacterium]
MKRTTALLASVFALSLVATPSIANDEMDTFKIDVVLADLLEEEGSDDFEKRLQRAARRYCDGYAPGSTRRAARQCERDVIAAVEDAIEERQLEIRLANQT